MGCSKNFSGIYTPLVDNGMWNSPHIGKQQSQDCARFDELIALLNRNGFSFSRVDLMDLAKRIGDGCSVTGQFRNNFAASRDTGHSTRYMDREQQ